MVGQSLVDELDQALAHAHEMLVTLKNPTKANGSPAPDSRSFSLPELSNVDPSVVSFLGGSGAVIYGGDAFLAAHDNLQQTLNRENLNDPDEKQKAAAAVRIKQAFDQMQDALGSLTVNTDDAEQRDALFSVVKKIAQVQDEVAGITASAGVLVVFPKKRKVVSISKNVASDESNDRFRTIMAEIDQYMALLHEKETEVDHALSLYSLDKVLADWDARAKKMKEEAIKSGEPLTAASLSKINRAAAEKGVKDQLEYINDLLKGIQTTFLGGRLDELENKVAGKQGMPFPTHEKQLLKVLQAKLVEYKQTAESIQSSRRKELTRIAKVLHVELKRRMKGEVSFD